SFDYEIGTRLSAKLGLDCCTISFEEKDYYEKVGRPSMYFKNGLINHLVHMPGRIYEPILGDDDGVLILSGHLGDRILTWCHPKNMILYCDNEFPEPVLLSFEDVRPIMEDEEVEIYCDRLNQIVDRMRLASG